MAAPTSAVEVCNLALDLLKQDAIASITAPTTGTESICARWYDHVRRATLRKHPWNFAATRDTVTANATAPAFGYSAAFDLPNDFIRLLTIGDDAIDDLQGKYQLEDGQLLFSYSTDSALKIRYVYDFTDVAHMDPLFIDVLAAEIALRIAYKVTGSDDATTRITEHLKLIAPEAYAIDGQERPPQRIQRSKFLDARGRGSSSGVAGKWTNFE